MDLIANMLTTIRNAQAVKHKSIVIPFSNFKQNILFVLNKKGYIGEIEIIKSKNRKNIKVFLKYNEDGTPAISEIKKISKQGQRVYFSYKDIIPFKNSHGIKIISTSKGLLTDKESKRKKAGGEVICAVF